MGYHFSKLVIRGQKEVIMLADLSITEGTQSDSQKGFQKIPKIRGT